MKSEEYVSRRQEIYNKIHDLECQLNDLREEYIQSSPLYQFKIGEKVEVYSPERTVFQLGRKYTYPEGTRYAYVKGYDIGYNSEVKLKLFKAKKDGSPSKFEDTYSPHWGEVIRKIKS